MGELSEMAQIRNLHWWTVEYGLIGTVENPRFMVQDYVLYW
jgi:phenylalanine-4-hydroxylase